ncbi:hypothetical protein SteCoe_16712 [Stentor coeruleus]|uniref:Uncharacterized protein n=1 Tax=Stentor coeruleus TaxID=5963 RepID=A0A1R2C0J8_9CILI|nr:hypothetical protein SteCoe_16712 [Stentor coeruleus]
MITISDFKALDNLQDTPVLNIAKIIDDQILIPLSTQHHCISLNSDHKNLYKQKIKTILESMSSDLQALSSNFWNRPLENPVIIEEVIAALVLKFLLGMYNSVQLERILYCFQYSRFKSLADILKKIIVSNELKSFNISGFLLYTDFKYLKTLSSETQFWSNNITAEIKSFDDYFDDFMEFLSNNSLFTEYIKDMSHIDEDSFNFFLNSALRNTVLVQKQVLEWYGADGFTSHDRKIYLGLFETGYSVMDKAAIFYVLLHELCHYFQRISCRTWEDSRNCRTPEEIIGNVSLSEARNIFEIKFFGERHRFLNENVCDFFLSSTEKLSQEEYSKRFASINKSKGNVYISLMRGTCLKNKGLVELRGCLISRNRGYD